MPNHGDIRTERDWRLWLATDRPTIHCQLLTWLAIAKSPAPNLAEWHSCEMHEDEIAVLVRDRTNGVTGRCLTVATVRLPEHMQSRGWFKSFLTDCCEQNPWPSLVIEDVENARLRGFLERLNCEVLNDFYRTTYVVNRAAVLELNAGPLLPSRHYGEYLPGCT